MQMNVSALSVDDGRADKSAPNPAEAAGYLQFRSLLMPSADRRLTVRTAILRRPLALSALLRPLDQQEYAALAVSSRSSQWEFRIGILPFASCLLEFWVINIVREISVVAQTKYSASCMR